MRKGFAYAVAVFVVLLGFGLNKDSRHVAYDFIVSTILATEQVSKTGEVTSTQIIENDLGGKVSVHHYFYMVKYKFLEKGKLYKKETELVNYADFMRVKKTGEIEIFYDAKNPEYSIVKGEAQPIFSMYNTLEYWLLIFLMFKYLHQRYSAKWQFKIYLIDPKLKKLVFYYLGMLLFVACSYTVYDITRYYSITAIEQVPITNAEYTTYENGKKKILVEFEHGGEKHALKYNNTEFNQADFLKENAFVEIRHLKEDPQVYWYEDFTEMAWFKRGYYLCPPMLILGLIWVFIDSLFFWKRRKITGRVLEARTLGAAKNFYVVIEYEYEGKEYSKSLVENYYSQDFYYKGQELPIIIVESSPKKVKIDKDKILELLQKDPNHFEKKR